MVSADQEDILVAKWLYEKKYFSALVDLENDAGVQLHEATSQMKLIKKICLDGDFDGLQILMTKMFNEPNLSLFRFSILRHELLERLSCIKSRDDVERFVSDLDASRSILGSELVAQLEAALMLPDPMRHDIYDGWSKIKGRYELFESMLPVLRRIFPDQSYTLRLSESAPSNPLERIVSDFRRSHTAEYDSFFHGPKFSTPIESPAPLAVQISDPPKPHPVRTPPPVSALDVPRPQTIPSETVHPAYKVTRKYKDSSNSPVRAACFSPDGKRIAIGTNSQSLIICDIQANAPILSVSRRVDKVHAGSVYSMAWSGSIIATGSNDQTIKLTLDDPTNTRPGNRIKLQSGTVRGLDFHMNGKSLFAGCSGDSWVRQIDSTTGLVSGKFACSSSTSLNDSTFINSVCCSDSVVVCALSNGTVAAVDDRCTSAAWRISTGNTSTVAHSAGTYVAIGTESGNVGLYDIRSSESIPVWLAKSAHSGACRSVSVSHSTEPVVASGSFDKKIKLWKSGQNFSTLDGQHTDRVVFVHWYPPSKDQLLVSCGTDSSVLLWQPEKVNI